MDPGHVTTTTALLHTLRQSQDSEVWAVFEGRYSPILQAIARRLGLSPEDAEDVAQQTLLEFVRDLRDGRYDRSRGRLRSWIVAIARNRSHDIHRRTRARREASWTGEEVGEEQARLESMWDEEEQTHIAKLAWTELAASQAVDPRSLEVFDLVAMRGVPPAEVGERLGMSSQAVYAAKFRIAEKLRSIVDRLNAEFEATEP